MKFVIIVAMYNMAPWIGRNIESIKNQSYRRFRCMIGDDLSTDDGADRAVEAIDGDERFELLVHREKMFSMGNIYSLIEKAAPDDDDVIVLVDGDDHLAHGDVLKRLVEIYNETRCWMTYGSYAGNDGRRDLACKPYPPSVVQSNRFRSAPWCASHLKTFKYGLWRQIPADALTVTDEEYARALRRALLTLRFRTWNHWRRIAPESLTAVSGRFIRRCDDKAFTLAMLELAGAHARFVEQVLYIYNTYEKELDFGKKPVHQKWYTRLIRDILKHKPRLHPIDGRTAVPTRRIPTAFDRLF